MMLLQESFWFPTLRDLYWFSPELTVVGTIAALLIVPLITGRSASITGRIALFGVALALYFNYRVSAHTGAHGVSGLAPSAAGGMLILDNVTVFFKYVLLLFIGGITALWFMGSASRERAAPEFFTLLLGSALGMMLMTATLNILMIAVAIELASLPSYAIVGFNKRNRAAAEASLKYVVFGGISLAIMMYGASLIYGVYHTLDFVQVARQMTANLAADQNTITIGVALACLMAGIAFKIAAVPFHFWCPDAFEGAQIEVTAWLSVASKGAALVLLVRLVNAFAIAASDNGAMEAVTGIAWGLGIMAAVTCTWGNFAAYRQSNIKRLLAYSSIAHAGYMMMAAAVFVNPNYTTSNTPVAAILIYLLLYAIMNFGAFTVAAIVSWQTGSEDISAFSGLGRRAPWIAVPMVCCLVSLVGLPPFGGFIGKIWILMSLGEQRDPLYWGLVVVAVVNTLISLFYYLRIVKAMFFIDDRQPGFSPSAAGVALTNSCAVALLALGVLFINGPKNVAERYAKQMFVPSMGRTAMDVDDDAPLDLNPTRAQLVQSSDQRR